MFCCWLFVVVLGGGVQGFVCGWVGVPPPPVVVLGGGVQGVVCGWVGVPPPPPPLLFLFFG